MTSKRKIKFGGLAVAVGLVSSVLAAPTAAQAAFTDCPQEIYCLWTEYNGEGSRLFSGSDEPDLRVHGLNDVISSVYNTSSTRGLCLYPDINYYSGSTWTVYLPPGTTSNLRDPNIDNRVSSVKWAGPTGVESCK